MKPFFWASAAMFLFVFQNHLYAKYMRHYDPIYTIVVMYASILVFAIPISFVQRNFGIAIEKPLLPTNLLWAGVICGLIYLAADFCYLTAYNIGGDIRLITVAPVTLPVFLSLFHAVIGEQKVSIQYIVGLGIVGVGLVVVALSIPKSSPLS